MASSVVTHLMFEGAAEEAMRFYVQLFPGSEISSLEHYGPDAGPAAGKVKLARFTIIGRPFLCIDSPIAHDFTFTPSMSMFVECDTLEELQDVFGRLAADGAVLMPVDNYGFSTMFGWVKDRYGVSWQLNLA